MPNLKLGLIPDEKPVKLTVELPAGVHRDLVAYGDLLAGETGQAIDVAQLVAPMLAKFMLADRGFTKARRHASRPIMGAVQKESEPEQGSKNA